MSLGATRATHDVMLQYHQAVSTTSTTSTTASSRSSNGSTVRFAVGKPEGPRSTVWRLWTHKNEVYISAWSLASDVKISLHSSGDAREVGDERLLALVAIVPRREYMPRATHRGGAPRDCAPPPGGEIRGCQIEHRIWGT
jgi:hypothetical protein